MKKVMVSVGLGLATVSQAHAWTGGVEDMRTMQANQDGNVVRVKAKRVQCCRLQPGRAHGHSHQEKIIHNGRTYYCTDVSNTMKTRHVQQQQAIVQHHHHVSHSARHQIQQRNHQQALQAQRAKRQAMFAAQAKRKAILLAQQRKRAAMLEQQKRRKVQLAQQQQRAAHQAAMLAAKQRRAALVLQQKRRAQQLAQQRRQQAQKRAMLLAQQKRHAAQQRVNQRPCNCANTRKPARIARQRVVQPQITYKPQVVTSQNVVQNAAPQEVVISRRIITTHVHPSQLAAPAPVRVVRPRILSSQGLMQQSVDYHDRHHARTAWQQTVQSADVTPKVAQHHAAVTVQKSAVRTDHEARLRHQRLQQIRAAQIAAAQRKHHMASAPPVKMAPMAPYTAPAYVSSSQSVKSHKGGWQRNAAVNAHSMRSSYGIYQG